MPTVCGDEREAGRGHF